jgi:hypothetical protein
MLSAASSVDLSLPQGVAPLTDHPKLKYADFTPQVRQ